MVLDIEEFKSCESIGNFVGNWEEIAGEESEGNTIFSVGNKSHSITLSTQGIKIGMIKINC